MSTSNIYELLKTYIPKKYFEYLTTIIHINDTYSKWLNEYQTTLDSYNNDENELLILRAILNDNLKYFTLTPPNPLIPSDKYYLYTDVFETIMSDAHQWCINILTSDIKCIIATNPIINKLFSSSNTWAISRGITNFFSSITPNAIKTLKYGRWGLADGNTLGNNIEMITRLFYTMHRLNYLYCALNNNNKPSIIKSVKRIPSNNQNTINNYLFAYEIIYTNNIVERVSIKQTVENYMKKFALTTVSGIILPIPLNIQIPQTEIKSKYFMAFLLYLFATNSNDIENKFKDKDINTKLLKSIPILKSLLVYNILQTHPPNGILHGFFSRYPKINFVKKIIIEKQCHIDSGFLNSKNKTKPDEGHRELDQIANSISKAITNGSSHSVSNLAKLTISSDYLIPDNIYTDLLQLEGFKLSETIKGNKPLTEYLGQTITQESIVKILRSNTVISVLDVGTTGAIKGASTAVIGTGVTAAIAYTGIIVSAPITGPVLIGIAGTGAIAGALGSLSNEYLGINEGIGSTLASFGVSQTSLLSSGKMLSITSSSNDFISANINDKSADNLIKAAAEMTKKLDLGPLSGRTRLTVKVVTNLKLSAIKNKVETAKAVIETGKMAASQMSSVLVEAGVMSATATTLNKVPKIKNTQGYAAMGLGVHAINTNPKMLYPAITRKAINRRNPQNTKKNNSKPQNKPQIYKHINFNVTAPLQNTQFDVPLFINPNTSLLPKLSFNNTIPRIAPNIGPNIASNIAPNFSRNPIDEISFFINPNPFNMERLRHPEVNQLPRPEATPIPKRNYKPKNFEFEYPPSTPTPYTNEQRVSDIRKSQAWHQAILSSPFTLHIVKFISSRLKIGNRFHNNDNNNNDNNNNDNNNVEGELKKEDENNVEGELKKEGENNVESEIKKEGENKVESEIKKESEICIKYIDTFIKTYFDEEGNLNLKIVEYNFKDFFDKIPSFNENNMVCLIAIFESLKLKFIDIKNKDTTSLKYQEFIELLYTLKKMILFIEEFYSYYVSIQSEEVPNLNETNEVPKLENDVIIVWIGVSKDYINKFILNYTSMYENNNHSHINMTPYGDTLFELYPVLISELEIDNTPPETLEYNTLNCILSALGISLENFDKIKELFEKDELNNQVNNV